MIRTKTSLSTRLANVLTSVIAKPDRTSENVDALFDNGNRAELNVLSASLRRLREQTGRNPGSPRCAVANPYLRDQEKRHRYGGMLAAGRTVAEVITDLAPFCGKTA
jgi:hypothetical protein